MTEFPESSITILLVESARMMRNLVDSALEAAGLDLTPGEARALAYASRSSAIRPGVLAAQMSIDPMTLNGHLERLEIRGLVDRQPDPDDGRAKLVRVTPEAKPVLALVFQVTERVRGSALRGISVKEEEQLRDLLRRVRSNIAAQEGRPPKPD
ncbi:MAG TPA: MarR family transcriptional regulator [Sphingomicrobium sp.]|nr:MarR family transcriptional regulator [Sphingomicrobium sp.]